MDYAWGYAAARTPLPNNYTLRRPSAPRQSTSSRDRGQQDDEIGSDELDGQQKKSGDSEGWQEETGQAQQQQQAQRAPLPPIDPHFYPPFLRYTSRRPSRSNSTSQATASRRRPRILGHTRTSSSSSRSNDSASLQQYQLDAGTPGAGGPTHRSAETAAAVTSERMSGSGPGSGPGRYYQTKQLPATPRLETFSTSDDTAANRHKLSKTGTTSEEVSARTPASATTPRHNFTFSFPTSGSEAAPLAAGLSSRPPASSQQQQQQQHAGVVPEHTAYLGNKMPAAAGISTPYTIPSSSSAGAAAAAAAAYNRAESISSTSGATTTSGRTMYSSAAPSGADLVALQQRPFVVRDGRSYVADPTLHYPLPVDLTELHRQSLRTLLLIQLFNGPLCSPVFSNRPPTRVLEVGCGSAFWSMMCHRYYARHGHTNISFTGIDVAPIAPGTSTSARAGSTSAASGEAQSKNTRASASSATSTTPLSGLDGKPDKDMRWRFVQHDMRRLPWPFPDGEFDLVMVKDMSLATPLALQQTLMDEYVRLLRPGGVLEVWESDHTVRMLRPHVPESGRQQQQQQQQAAAAARNGSRQKDEDSDDDEDDSSEEEEDEEDDDDDDSDDDDDDDDDSDEDENEAAANLGAYLMTPHTPLSAPTNNYLVEYNAWVARALEARSLSAVPCTLIGSLLLQEVDTLTALGSKRLAVPLSEVRWEREGVGGVVTKDGKSYVESTKGYPAGKKGVAPAAGVATASAPVAGTRPALGPGQAAVRRTALMTVVQQIQSLEAVLREVSGKSQDEWDGWCGKMMNDLVKDNGTSWGECLEIGAWWARKKA